MNIYVLSTIARSSCKLSRVHMSTTHLTLSSTMGEDVDKFGIHLLMHTLHKIPEWNIVHYRRKDRVWFRPNK